MIDPRYIQHKLLGRFVKQQTVPIDVTISRHRGTALPHEVVVHSSLTIHANTVYTADDGRGQELAQVSNAKAIHAELYSGILHKLQRIRSEAYGTREHYLAEQLTELIDEISYD